MNKYYFKFVVILLGLLLAACSQTEADQSASAHKDKIILGSVGSDVEIWKHIAASEQAKALGLNIEVKEINDGVALNRGVLDDELDVNAFQSWAYFKEFNQLNNQKLAVIATMYLEPMGLYSKKYHSLDKLPQHAVVAIPNDVANTTRALRLLERGHLIQLKAGFNPISGSIQDIQENPKNLQFKLVKGAQGPRVLGEVDLVAIGNTTALESGLNVIKDSIFHENVEDKTMENINILVVRRERLSDENLKKLGDLYHQPFVNAFIQKHFGGTKLDINIPVSDLK